MVKRHPTTRKQNQRNKKQSKNKKRMIADKKKNTTKKSTKEKNKIVFEDEKHDVDIPSRRIKKKNGAYTIDDKNYKKLVGTRDEVWQYIAYKTSYNKDDCLYRDDLFMCKNTGKIKSKARSDLMKQKEHNTLKKRGMLKTKKRSRK